jgi:hypothetical protein
VLPAELAYPALIEALGEGVEARAKELEVYADEEPPQDYGLETELAGVLREAEAADFERFHLVGYSGGARFRRPSRPAIRIACSASPCSSRPGLETKDAASASCACRRSSIAPGSCRRMS